MKSPFVVVSMLAAGIVCGEAAAQPASPPAPAAKRELVRRLLKVTGATSMAQQVIERMIDAQRKLLPQVPETLWQEIRTAMNAEDLETMVVPIYERHLEEGELRAILAFYDTPAGAKLLRVQPQILQESMAAGQAWGMEIGRRVGEKLREGGYVKE